MSGNGMRCLAQAAVLSALVTPPRFTVATAAGVGPSSTWRERTSTSPRRRWTSGTAVLGADQPQKFPDREVRTVDMGNPTWSCSAPTSTTWTWPGSAPTSRPSTTAGSTSSSSPRATSPTPLDLRVFERGVGETQACGTGSAAAAAAARSWGLVGDRVDGPQPGRHPRGRPWTATTVTAAGPGPPGRLRGRRPARRARRRPPGGLGHPVSRPVDAAARRTVRDPTGPVALDEPHRLGLHRHPHLPRGPGAHRASWGSPSPTAPRPPPRPASTSWPSWWTRPVPTWPGGSSSAGSAPDPATYWARARRRSSWPCAWRSTPTPWCSTTTSRRPSSGTWRRSSAGPPSTAPR